MPFTDMPWRNFRLGANHRYHALDQLRLMEYGSEYFPALELAITSAKNSVFLEVYIFADDEIGQRISHALSEAAKRGVDVRVIVDWVGSGRLAFEEQWNEAGVKFHYYNPKLFGPFGFSRTHRKIAIIDRLKAYVGGINICDDWQDISGQKLNNPRWDFTAEVNNDLAMEIEGTFLWQWQRTKQRTLTAKGIKDRIVAFEIPWKNLLSRPFLPKPGVSVGVFVARDNVHHRRSIEKAYLKAIGQSDHEIYLVNPYFLPGRRLRTALTAASRRGVKVTLLIGRGQFKWLDAAVTALYGALLKSGVTVYEYTADQMHAKLLVADRQWFTLGSSNCDPLSFLVNHEANIMITDSRHAAWLIDKIQDTIMLRGRIVEMEAYMNRSLWKKTIQWIMYMMSRAITRIYVFGSVSGKQ
jgi:cardiolipin synthase